VRNAHRRNRKRCGSRSYCPRSNTLSALANTHVATAGDHSARRIANGCGERRITGCIVRIANRVAKECCKAISRVGVAHGIAKQCLKPGGRVIAARGVAKQRLGTDGRIVRAGGVGMQRKGAVCRIVCTTVVEQKSSGTGGGILICGVEEERFCVDSGVKTGFSFA
jgi:hypothetical protein